MADPLKGKILLYGVFWDKSLPPISREISCIRHGGTWEKADGTTAGQGLAYHFKAAIKLLWPEVTWHRWMDLLLENWLAHKVVGVMGPANSGKTCSMALFHLIDYYAFPHCTTIIICSTSKERLEDRIWGEIKKWHKVAKQRFPWLPGFLIEGKQRLVTNGRSDAPEGRDFRNGVVGVPCRTGGQYVGLGDFIGIKNKRVRLCGDELQLLPKAFVDSISNLMKNPDCRISGMGNPKDTLDALGVICEPSAELGGWDGGIDQTPKSKTWPTRWPDGIAIQFSGSDSPNTDVDASAPVPFPFLITRKNMEDDAAVWGRDDWHFTMFNEGRMPRGQGSRRVITRRICEVGGAFDEPRWNDTNLTTVTFLDAAYRSVGGDRCVFGRLKFGYEAAVDTQSMPAAVAAGLVDQDSKGNRLKMILALIELKTIPITAGLMSASGEPEEQIVNFVRKEHEEYGVPPENFFYDSGMRTGLVQAFARMWSSKVNAIDCGGKPTTRPVSEVIETQCINYYSKLITEFWYSVRLIIECGQFRGMTQDLMAEGCAREFKLVSGNRIEVETKEDMKKKTGRSPDLFDALAIGVEGARRLGFRIGRLSTREEQVKDEKWKQQLREQASRLHRVGQLTYK